MLQQLKNQIIKASSAQAWQEIRIEFQPELLTYVIDQDINPFLEALTENREDYGIPLSALTLLESEPPKLELPSGTEVPDLPKINLEGVFPKKGWILKYNGNEFIPVLKEWIKNTSVNTTIEEDVDYAFYQIVGSVDIQRKGLYKITISFSHSVDDTRYDIVVSANIAGKKLTDIARGEILRKEGKDSAGNDSDGRGTDQKEGFTMVYFMEINQIGNHPIELFFNSSKYKVEASMWDASIEIEETF